MDLLQCHFPETCIACFTAAVTIQLASAVVVSVDLARIAVTVETLQFYEQISYQEMLQTISIDEYYPSWAIRTT